MAEVFIRLLGMSLTASYLILAVIVVRVLLKRVPKKTICMLWGLAAIRLVLPFSLESTFSLLPNVHTARLVSSIQSFSKDIFSGAELQPVSGVTPVNKIAESLLIETWTQATATSARPFQAEAQVASIVWLVGMAILITFSLISYLELRRRVSCSIRVKKNLYRCDAIDTPFVLGLISPKIYLPFTLDDQYLEFVIAHETAHIKRRDHWIKPVGFILLAIYWFNPFVWLAYIMLCRDIELACDEKVLDQIGAYQKKAYSASLLACSIKHSSIAMCPVAFGEIGVKQRIKNVLNYKKPVLWLTLVAVVVCLIVTFGFLTDPIGQNAVVVTEQMDRAVSTAILDHNKGIYPSLECNGEGHQILHASEKEDLLGQKILNIYAFCSYSTYEFLNGTLVMSSGNSMIPTVMTFMAARDGSYQLADYKEARDGTQMEPSIRQMFPKAIQDAVLQAPDETRKELKRQQSAYAASYLQKIGRITLIGDLPDFDFISLSSLISTSASNELWKQYGEYSDLANPQSMSSQRESVEGGTRFLYEVIWEGDGNQKGRITFRKSIFDTAKIVSNFSYLVDGDHYQQINQNMPSKQATGPEFEFNSINPYITYRLPATLVDGIYNRELGYLGGNLFGRKDSGSFVAKEASDSTPPGWNSYGGVELYYQLTCQFNNGQLTNVFLPWNHSIDLTTAEPLSDCAAPAVIVQIGFDLYTAPEAQQLNIAKDKQTATMWYVFFAKEDSEISYAVFLNAEHYSKEDTISLARSVKFSADAFRLVVK